MMSNDRYTGGSRYSTKLIVTEEGRGLNRWQAESQELAIIHSPGGVRLIETDAKLRAMSLLNGRGAKEEDKVNPTCIEGGGEADD